MTASPPWSLSQLHLLLTGECKYECDHCFVWSSPETGNTMRRDTVAHILADLTRVEGGRVAPGIAVGDIGRVFVCTGPEVAVTYAKCAAARMVASEPSLVEIPMTTSASPPQNA